MLTLHEPAYEDLWFKQKMLGDEETRSYNHFDKELKGFIADVIIFSEYRGRGYGNQGLSLLCTEAKKRGVRVLYDDIAIDNPAIKLFLKHGFQEEIRIKDKIMLKKNL